MSYNLLTLQDKPTEGICSDASYLKTKNLLRWRVVEITTGEEVDRKGYTGAVTSYLTNIGEFLGIIAAMKYRDSLAHNPYSLEQVRRMFPIYSDSKVAIGWVQGMYVNTHLSKDDELIWREVVAGLQYLKSYPLNLDANIFHWHTAAWGNIPADFMEKGNKNDPNVAPLKY